MGGLTVQLPKPSILQPGEEENQLVQGYRDESQGLENRLGPIREQMGALEGEMSHLAGNMPPAPKLAQVPEFRPRQVDQGEFMSFGVLATALASLGARSMRIGVTGALDAAGKAIKGFNEGNIQQAKLDAENFQMQMRSVIANNHAMLQEYDRVLGDRKLTLAQKMQMYGVLAHKYNDEIGLSSVRKGDIRFELDRLDKIRTANNQIEAKFAQMEATVQAQLARLEAQQEPLIPVQQPDGTVRYLPRSQAAGGIVPPRNTGDKLTEAEAKGTLFWRQMSSAEEAASNLAGPTFNMSNLGSQFGVRMANSDWTNWLAPEKAQQYAQASEQWAEAYLRLKTGAATTADEIKRNARAYFPQPGDAPQTIIQKNQMRARAIQDVSIIAGRGVDKTPAGATPPGAPTPPAASPAAGTPPEGTRGTSRSGRPMVVRGGRWEYAQ